MPRVWLFGKMDSTELIAVRVAKMGELHHAHRRGFAWAGRIFGRGIAMCNCGFVKLFHLLWRVARDGDDAAVRDRRRFIVDRLVDDENRPVAIVVDQPGMAAVGDIAYRFADAEGAEYLVVEALRSWKRFDRSMSFDPTSV